MCKRCENHKCHDESKCCKKVYCKVKKIDETTTDTNQTVKVIDETTTDTNQTVKVIDETTKSTNECCAEVLEIVKNIQNKIAPIIDPLTGCQVSSQAIIDVRNLFNDTNLAICPQIGVFWRIWDGSLLQPSDGDISIWAKWQQWDDASVADQVALLTDTRNALQNLDFPGITEQERRTLLTLNQSDIWRFTNPRNLAVRTGNGWPPLAPFLDSMVGIFLINFGLFGFNFFADSAGLQLTIDSLVNFADSVTQYQAYLQRRSDEDLVWSQLDVDGSLGIYPLVTSIRVTALAPFAGDPLLPAAEAAYDNVEIAVQSLIDFLSPGGAYYTKAAALRGPDHPGLGAPGLNPEAKTIDYPYFLEINANTALSAADIHALGIQQVAEIQPEIVDIVNTYVSPGDPVADWTELNTRYNTVPAFRELFETQVTVGELISGTESLVYQAYSNCIKAFQNFPSSPVEVNPRVGFSAASYSTPTVQNDGTKSVILQNGRFNLSTLSNTSPIDPSEVVTAPKSLNSSTVYHESFPGHHFNLGIQVETACNVAGARNGGAVEGWGLYSEKVAANDMGLALVDPAASNAGVPVRPFRRIDFLVARLFRAVRLVVDTGLHDLGWSRQEVVDYFILNTIDLPEAFIQSEVDRYTVWPGQACGYLIGALVYDRERERAENALGADFNLAQYHDVLLRFITPVESSIIYLTDFYIDAVQAGTFDDLWPSITPQPLKAPLTASQTANPAMVPAAIRSAAPASGAAKTVKSREIRGKMTDEEVQEIVTAGVTVNGMKFQINRSPC